VLVGGLGKRLGSMTLDTPKPLLSVGGRPFLEYVVWNLRRHGVVDVVLSVGYLARKVMGHFGEGSRFGVAMRYAVERDPAGTGGALLLARNELDNAFLVVNGDTLFDINYLDLALALGRGEAALALRHVPDTGRYGQVCLEGNLATCFAEKGGGGPGLASGGVYALHRDVLSRLPGVPCSLEQDLFPGLASDGRLIGRAFDGFFVDIGVPEALRCAEQALPVWHRKPAVLLDRDGVLNADRGYVHSPQEFSWIQGAPEAVKELNDRGYLVLVVTNQAGIARGYYTEEEFLAFSRWMQEELRERGAHLDAVYYCPHHPQEGIGAYRVACTCRKPAPGLIQRALREWNVDSERSVMIGDSEIDLQAAQAAGIRSVLFEGDDLLEFVRSLDLTVAGSPTAHG